LPLHLRSPVVRLYLFGQLFSRAPIASFNALVPKWHCPPPAAPVYSTFTAILGLEVKKWASATLAGAQDCRAMKQKTILLLLLLVIRPVFAFGQTEATPLNRHEILGRLAVGFSPSYVANLIESRGIAFTPSENFQSAVISAGGDGVLVQRLSSSDVSRAPRSLSDPDKPTDSLAKCAELLHSGAVELAEKECRAAIDENPQSPWPVLATLCVLDQLGVSSEERDALLHGSLASNPDLAMAQRAREEEMQKGISVEGNQSDEAHGYLCGSQCEADFRDRPELEPFSPAIENQINSEIEHILKTEPNLARSHLIAAHYYQSLGSLENAKRQLREALRLEPGNPGIHYALGYFYQSQHNLELEIAEFREAVRLVPYGYLEYQALADALVRDARLEEAIDGWRNLLVLSPKDLRASNALVQLYLQKNDHKSGIAELRRSLKASFDAGLDEGSYVTARFQDIAYLAVLLTENHEFDGAATMYELLLRFNPESASLHNNYGDVLFAERRFSDALLEYRDALQLQPDLPSVHHNLARCLAALKDLDGAISEFREALDINPDEPNTHTLLGVALGQKGDRNGAVDQFHEAIIRNPSDAPAHAELAHIYFLNNNFPSAIAELKRALDCRPNFPAAENELARIYATSPDPRFRNPLASLSLARHAAQSSAEPVPEFLDTLAEALLLNCQPVEALKTEERAVKLAPEDHKIQSRLVRFQQAVLASSPSLHQ